MAGFVGICSKVVSVTPEAIDDAVKATVYADHTHIKDLHADKHLVLKKSFVSFIEADKMEASRENVHVWIDGEIYNQASVADNMGDYFADTLLNHYLKGSLEPLLSKVDGIFIAVIYDLRTQQLHTITDRYGLKIFYLSAKNNCLILAPELKCFPFFHPFRLEIRADVVDCFVQLEHMMGSATWFKGVEVTAPATVYTYSWQTDSLTQKRYWSWSAIDRSSISLDDAVEELGFLLEQAIQSRKFGNCKIGLGLSGGFDSRAILAAIRNDKPVTYTFGTEDSSDVRIAKKVAAVANVRNIHFDMHVENWLQKRYSGVWKTDGMMNMYHMHYSHLMNEIPKLMDVNMSGFLGDGVLGQTYLLRKGKLFLNKRVDDTTAQYYYGRFYEFCDPNDAFFDIPKLDAYLIYNRGRRLTGLGMEEANKTVYQRLPFMDIKLMDFSYSLPDEYRHNSVMYHQALLLRYPDFYQHIPHATSGLPVQKKPSVYYKTLKAYHRMVWIVKFKLGIATSFTDVYNWVKEPGTANFLREVLNPKHALYSNFTSRNFLTEFVDPHLEGKGNHVKQVMSALTMEVWLQQIMNKKYLRAE